MGFKYNFLQSEIFIFSFLEFNCLALNQLC